MKKVIVLRGGSQTLLFLLHLAKSSLLLICSEYYSLQQNIGLSYQVSLGQSLKNMIQSEYQNRLGLPEIYIYK